MGQKKGPRLGYYIFNVLHLYRENELEFISAKLNKIK